MQLSIKPGEIPNLQIPGLPPALYSRQSKSVGVGEYNGEFVQLWAASQGYKPIFDQ
jgi:hypothetical protein